MFVIVVQTIRCCYLRQRPAFSMTSHNEIFDSAASSGMRDTQVKVQRTGQPFRDVSIFHLVYTHIIV